jgi:Rod binding domain-containing protein
VGTEKRPAKKSPAETETVGTEKVDTGKGTLKVNAATVSLILRLAAMRGLTVAQLFVARDVEDFFTHLLLEEMRQASEQLRDRSKR